MRRREGGQPSSRFCHRGFWLPILVLLVGSLLIRCWDLDLVVQRSFWWAQEGWRLAGLRWIGLLYHYGCLPALVVGVAGCIVWAVSFRFAFLGRVRLFAGFLGITLMLGPGLLINGILKDHYGRLRPRQVQEFGGEGTYRPLGEPTFDGAGKSFPSGHAAMGFYWFAPAIYLWDRRRRLAQGMMIVALVHGGLMSFGRLAQGAHWLSDVWWSAGLVYLCSQFFYRALWRDLDRNAGSSPTDSFRT
ncbi:MAG: phosphatase PAP2 family protein [Verrucomicrobiae bacterium]|nr:phosphatase PAP2 family protein [Verrucomicrobiae bacterium]